MLTETDVHYLVGLLSLATQPEDVELTLGDFVFDEASKLKRDVDVTIKTKNPDGSDSVYIGTEVKAHGRKLGSITVEQLSQKLKDMPDITHRGIVSASGFTKPAIRKASYHNVDLYELRPWNPVEGFDFFKSESNLAFQQYYGWSGTPDVLINSSQTHTAEDQELIRSNPKVFVMDSPQEVCDLTTWLRNAGQQAAKKGVDQMGDGFTEGSKELPAQITIQFNDRPYIASGHQRLEIHEVRFSGILKRTIRNHPTVAKALFKVGESNPLTGCFITEFPSLGLIAFMVTAHRTLELGLVTVSDRNKNKIYKQRISKKQQ